MGGTEAGGQLGLSTETTSPKKRKKKKIENFKMVRIIARQGSSKHVIYYHVGCMPRY